jgi:hypothetical protein
MPRQRRSKNHPAVADERRCHPRVRLCLPVAVNVYEAATAAGELADISLGGLCVATHVSARLARSVTVSFEDDDGVVGFASGPPVRHVTNVGWAVAFLYVNESFQRAFASWAARRARDLVPLTLHRPRLLVR